MSQLSIEEKKLLILSRIHGEALSFKHSLLPLAIAMKDNGTVEKATLGDPNAYAAIKNFHDLTKRVDELVDLIRRDFTEVSEAYAKPGIPATTTVDNIVERYDFLAAAIYKLDDETVDIGNIDLPDWWSILKVDAKRIMEKIMAEGQDIDLANPALDGEADDDEPTIPGAKRQPTDAEWALHHALCNLPASDTNNGLEEETHTAFHDGDFVKFHAGCLKLGLEQVDNSILTTIDSTTQEVATS